MNKLFLPSNNKHMIDRLSPPTSNAIPSDDSSTAVTGQKEAEIPAPPSSTEKNRKGVYSSTKKRRIKRLLDSDSEKRFDLRNGIKMLYTMYMNVNLSVTEY